MSEALISKKSTHAKELANTNGFFQMAVLFKWHQNSKKDLPCYRFLEGAANFPRHFEHHTNPGRRGLKPGELETNALEFKFQLYNLDFCKLFGIKSKKNRTLCKFFRYFSKHNSGLESLPSPCFCCGFYPPSCDCTKSQEDGWYEGQHDLQAQRGQHTFQPAGTRGPGFHAILGMFQTSHNNTNMAGIRYR